MKFFVGAATAAYQVEGNNDKSDFWVSEHIPHSSYVDKSGIACDHYNRYEEDIKYLADAGCNAYRFSIEWARIEPEEGKYDMNEVEHYRKMLKCCKNNGIEPIVTLHHFSSPCWLIKKGGWVTPFVAEAFARYCAFVVGELKEYLNYICTINEANSGSQIRKTVEKAMSSVRNGGGQVGLNLESALKNYEYALREEGEAFGVDSKKIRQFLKPRTTEEEVFVMQAHIAAKKAIKKVMPGAKVGLTLSLYDCQAIEGGETYAQKMWDEDFTFYFDYFKNDDFLGVQSYSRKIYGRDGEMPSSPNAPMTQMNYEAYPQGIGNVVKKVAQSFKREIIVTENGIATADDDRRCEFIKQAVEGVLSAKESGSNVAGYLYWSLLDNFEWQLGFSKTFGLIAVDRKNNCERYPKRSLSVLGEIAEKCN